MKSFFSIFSIILATLLSINLAIAKNINLYSDPKSDAKIVGTVDSEIGIIPIFTPKGDWIKVADPRNGNVGWIKSTDLEGSGTTSFTFTQKSTGNAKPQTYQIIQFGGPEKLTPEQTKAMMKQMELRQEMVQKNIQQLMENMFPAGSFNFPVIVPVMIPVATEKSTTPSATPKTNLNSTVTKPADVKQ